MMQTQGSLETPLQTLQGSRLYRQRLTTGLIEESEIADFVIKHTEDPAVPLFVKHFQDRFGSHLLGVLFYGSCLRTKKDLASIRDFFVIVDRYIDCDVPPLHFVLSHVLPPNAYYTELTSSEGEAYKAKFSLVSLRLLQRQTSLQASDTYLFGRMGQKVALVYSRDPQSESEILRSLGRAVSTVVHCMLPLLPERFTSEDCVKQYLLWSYSSEVRPERQDSIVAIYDMDREYYDELYSIALKGLASATPVASFDEKSNQFICRLAPLYRGVRRIGVKFLGVKSRIRAFLRYIKWLFIFDHAMDYVISKLERHSGVKLELTPKQKRHPLLFGWPALFRLFRTKVIN